MKACGACVTRVCSANHSWFWGGDREGSRLPKFGSISMSGMVVRPEMHAGERVILSLVLSY